MAERLRRQTRNLLGYTRTGSNPVRDESPFAFFFIDGSDILESSVRVFFLLLLANYLESSF